MGAYIYLCPPDHHHQIAMWGFDRIDWSNNFLSYISSVPELREHELERWHRLHYDTFGENPRLPSGPEPAPSVPPDVTPLHLDNPADADYLGRRGFAEALAVRLNQVWGECNRPGERTTARSSFVLHLHGP